MKADTLIGRFGVFVQRQDDLGVVVRDLLQWGKLPRECVFIPDACGDLDVLYICSKCHIILSFPKKMQTICWIACIP